MANATTVQLGAWSPLTDTFVAHPNAPTGAIYDLNDNVNWTLVDAQEGFGTGLEITPPAPELLKTGNSRSVGERIVRRNYSHNRKITAKLLQIPQVSSAAWNANLRALFQLCEGISVAQPAALKIQLTTGSGPTYADVLSAQVTTRYKETLFAQLMNDEVTVTFECRPFLRGARQTLSNLITNPGFEAPSGPGVVVFNDQISTLNAYSAISGSPTLSSANIVLPANAAVLFGSSVWSAFNTWQARFNITSGATASFYLHYVDANNYLRFDVSSGGYVLYQVVAGAATTVASGAVTISTSFYYWISATQFPSAPGTVPDVTITVNSDSSGVIGPVVATVGPVALASTVATSGKMGFLAQTATANFGGFAGKMTNIVSLFGPGGWQLSQFSANAFGAWDQSTANTYPGGAVTSYGAARIDAPPVGAFNAGWTNYNGGTPTGTNALPVSAAGNVIAASAWVKTSGLAGTGSVALTVREWAASGTSLRQTTLQTLTGNVTSWTQMSGVVTTGANTAYVDVILLAMDGTSASANATIWFDNAQCWNQTTTGQTVMPYCELRFPQSPAQLLLTGVQGDVPVPAQVSIGAFFSSLPTSTTLALRLGRRSVPTANWATSGALVRPVIYNALDTYALNSAAYGGFTISYAASTHIADQPLFVSEKDMQGVYHVLCLIASTQSAANLPSITTRIAAYIRRGSAYTQLPDTALGAYYGATLSAGLASTSVFTVTDAGQYSIPSSAAGVLADLSTIYDMVSVQFMDPHWSGQTWTNSWVALLPIDGGYLAATILFPSNMSLTLSNTWLWVYSDGVATQVGQAAAWRYSLETAGVAAPANGVGATGGVGTGYPSVNPAADAFLTLDPGATVNGVRGVNQLLAQWNDQNGSALPIACESQYVPLYLWPF